MVKIVIQKTDRNFFKKSFFRKFGFTKTFSSMDLTRVRL